MAKITLKNYDELIVTDEVAAEVKKDKELTVEAIDMSLPYTIHHEDGLWVGSLKDIATIQLNEKRPQMHFLTDENKLQFHQKHGYGKYQDKYESNYGLLDVQTQYLIGAGLAELSTDSYGRKKLNMIHSDKSQKYADLWKDYLTKLDPFNELK